MHKVNDGKYIYITPWSASKRIQKLNSCFTKKTLQDLCVVFHHDSESGLGIKIGQRQPECRRKPHLHQSSCRHPPDPGTTDSWLLLPLESAMGKCWHSYVSFIRWNAFFFYQIKIKLTSASKTCASPPASFRPWSSSVVLHVSRMKYSILGEGSHDVSPLNTPGGWDRGGNLEHDRPAAGVDINCDFNITSAPPSPKKPNDKPKPPSMTEMFWADREGEQKVSSVHMYSVFCFKLVYYWSYVSVIKEEGKEMERGPKIGKIGEGTKVKKAGEELGNNAKKKHMASIILLLFYFWLMSHTFCCCGTSAHGLASRCKPGCQPWYKLSYQRTIQAVIWAALWAVIRTALKTAVWAWGMIPWLALRLASCY